MHQPKRWLARGALGGARTWFYGKDFRRLPDAIPKQMHIPHRRRDLLVTTDLLHRLEIETFCDHERRCCMPQVVKADRLHA